MNLISIGEVLWDVVEDTEHLGGAPLNFAAHAARLGHSPYLVSAVGSDDRGNRALTQMQAFGLTTEYIRSVADQPTGFVSVTLHHGGQPSFTIHRPAAYDFALLSTSQLEQLARTGAEWIYFGTLAHTSAIVRSTTSLVLEAVPSAKRFYDVNLRTGCYSAKVVFDLLSSATVTKLNDLETGILENLLGDSHHKSIEDFCRRYAARFGWEAICVTRGDQGCALLLGPDYIESPAYSIEVEDTIGAGDAFSAGLVHGLSAGWHAERAAEFANRLGALVASRSGAIPKWNLQELERFPQVSGFPQKSVDFS
ncbi:MAG TPA: carbohydrate kinase [Candidatus Dormibacteraeota bacterium]|nr:carbohydrate kinase [Candidatus Dormibacteraeota bacterium]